MKSYEGLCNGFLVGKHTKRRYDIGNERRPTSTLDLFHNDVSRPIPTISINGSRQFLISIQDYTRHCWIYFLKQKSKVFETFKNFKALVENTLGKKIKALKLDIGGDYITREFQQLCASTGLKMQHLVPYTPQQNGIAKRKNVSLKEIATCLLEVRNIPSCLWDEAVSCTSYIQNIVPHNSMGGVTPSKN